MSELERRAPVDPLPLWRLEKDGFCLVATVERPLANQAERAEIDKVFPDCIVLRLTLECGDRRVQLPRQLHPDTGSAIKDSEELRGTYEYFGWREAADIDEEQTL